MNRGIVKLAVALGAVAAGAGPAAAHQTAVKYADVHVDGADVTIVLRAQPADVTRPLHLPDDATPTVEQALAAAGDVGPFIQSWLAIRNGDAACTAAAPAVAPAAADPRFLAITWTVRCAAPIDTLVLDFDGFFAVDKVHEVLLHLTAPDADAYNTTIDLDDSPVSLRLGDERPSTVWAWIWQGMVHIYTGRDHIAFVLALLLVVVIARKRPGVWETRPFWPALKATATVITAFTIAHSLTLIAASLGWFHLPIRFVESMIGASIAYTAVENIVKPDVTWRYLLTFGFGLVHGLGFASVLAELLPPDQVVAPLLEFNVGVELGQLSIVAVALPLFALAARLGGAGRYRKRLLPVASGAIAVLGAIWVVERVFAIELLGL